LAAQNIEEMSPSEFVERSFGSPAAGVLTNRQGKCAKWRPCFIEPIKALPVKRLPEGDWLDEIKFDGYRALAFKEGKDVRLVSRNQEEFNYPQLLDALKLYRPIA
jgi:bifunctional non-homologous end joining protein LigD